MINIAGRGSNSRSLVYSNTADLMPRAGIAFQVRPKTVIRGGFGVFYTHENDGKNVILTQNYPFYTEQEITSSPYYIDYNLSTGVPRPTVNPVPSSTASLNLTTVAGASTQVVQSEPVNFPTAFTNGYNVTVEQQLGNSTSFQIGYVGATSRNLSQKVGNYNVNNHLSSKLGTVDVTQASGLGNYDSLQGSWSFGGDPKDVALILDGIRAKLGPGVDIRYAKGTTIKRGEEIALTPDKLPAKESRPRRKCPTRTSCRLSRSRMSPTKW